MGRQAGTRLDPKIVEAFQALIGELNRGGLELAAWTPFSVDGVDAAG